MDTRAKSAVLQGLKAPPELHLTVPGDKSLSHRALIMAALARGKTRIVNLLRAEDVASTCGALVALGARIEDEPDGAVSVEGGLAARSAEAALTPVTLACGNSGTTMRLMLGVLSGLGRAGRLEGDASLSTRPMARVIAPLRAMGARIASIDATREVAPLELLPHSGLCGAAHTLKIASGQIKGALLLAGLLARGTTVLEGALGGRDHTERMLGHFGARLAWDRTAIRLEGPQAIVARDVAICGDASAAAFWLALAAVCPGGKVRIDHVMLNETRLGFVRLLGRMGAKITIVPARAFGPLEEPFGTLVLEHRPLKSTRIGSDDVPALIDELPLVAVLATQAHGTTRVRGAGELRHKESDRIAAICAGLGRMGAQISACEDGFDVVGPQPLFGAAVDSQDDHRIAMALSIAAMVAQGTTLVGNSTCVNISYPSFYEHLPEQVRG